MVHLPMIITSVVVLHLHVHTVQEATESARQAELDLLHTTSTTIEVTHEDHLLESHTRHRDDTRSHTIAELHLLQPEAMILTLVVIHMQDLAVHLLLEVMVAMVVAVVVTAAMMIDATRQCCRRSIHTVQTDVYSCLQMITCEATKSKKSITASILRRNDVYSWTENGIVDLGWCKNYGNCQYADIAGTSVIEK